MSKRAKIARAWREMARRIDAGRWGRLGLCDEVAKLADTDVWAAMKRQLGAHLLVTPCGCDVCADTDREQRACDCWLDEPGRKEARVLACLMLALEAKDAARSI